MRRKIVVRDRYVEADAKVADAVFEACRDGEPTPTRADLAARTGVKEGVVGDRLRKMIKRGTLRTHNPKTVRVVWEWLATGQKTAPREHPELTKVRNYVSNACHAHRLTPSQMQIARLLGDEKVDMARFWIRELISEGSMERFVAEGGGVVWKWVPTGSTTRPRVVAHVASQTHPRPSKPTKAEVEAGLDAMRRYRFADDPRAVTNDTLGSRPMRPDPARASTAALAVAG